jgi:hypothetical protein
MNSVLNLILSHESASAIAKMIAYWSRCVPSDSVLIAYGGTKSEFDAIQHTQKFFVDDPRLRTRDSQRELQSYTRLFQAAAGFLNSEGGEFRFIHFAEYDQVPLVPDLNRRQIERLGAEGADLLGFHLHRVDGTSSPHFLYHASNEKFASYWQKVSRRSEPEVILSMFGSGSFWNREAFCAVAAVEEPFPMYMEIYLPTLAHHLGFRVRDFAEQNRFVRVLRDETGYIQQAREEGGWTLHPVKQLWNNLCANSFDPSVS